MTSDDIEALVHDKTRNRLYLQPLNNGRQRGYLSQLFVTKWGSSGRSFNGSMPLTEDFEKLVRNGAGCGRRKSHRSSLLHFIPPTSVFYVQANAFRLRFLALLYLVPVPPIAQGPPFDTGFSALQTLSTGIFAKLATLLVSCFGRYLFPFSPKQPPLQLINSSAFYQKMFAQAPFQNETGALQYSYGRNIVDARDRYEFMHCVDAHD